jgi:hypothetical protein
MAITLYPNGQIPLAALDPVPSALGGDAYLLPLVAASFMRVREAAARIGFDLRCTSAGDGFRSYQRQVNVFRQRYRRSYAEYSKGRVDKRTWDDAYARQHGLAGVYYRYNGPAAAVPGTSNHGKGITVDIAKMPGYGTARFNQLAALLAAEGWSNAEGARIDEPWHWNQTRTAYHVVDTNTLPGVDIPIIDGRLPGGLVPEEDIMASRAELQEDLAQTRREIVGELQKLVRPDGSFRVAKDGVVYYGNLGTGAWVAVPNEEYHGVLISMEPDVPETNPRQVDLLADWCARVRASLHPASAPLVATLDPSQIAQIVAGLGDDVAERVANELFDRLAE